MVELAWLALHGAVTGFLMACLIGMVILAGPVPLLTP